MLNTHILHLTSQCHQVPTVHVWAIFIPTKAVETTMFQIAKVRPSTVQWRILTTEKKTKKNKCWKLKMLKLLRYDYLREKTVCSSFTQHFPDVWFSPSILEFSARSNHLSKTSGWTSASHSHAKKGQAKFGLALTSRKTWSLDGFASPTVAYQGIKLSRVTITLIVFIYLTIRPHDG